MRAAYDFSIKHMPTPREKPPFSRGYHRGPPGLSAGTWQIKG